jgi:ribosomal protein L37AE/L43A
MSKQTAPESGTSGEQAAVVEPVTECGSCGSTLVYFDPADGWSCNGCGRNDSDG